MVQPQPPQLWHPSELVVDRVKMLLFADFGVGKTTFAGTAPNNLFLSVEGGEMALYDTPYPELMDPRTRGWRVGNMDGIRSAYWYIINNLHGFGEFETVTIDSLTDLQDKTLFEVMARREQKSPNAPKGQPQRQDWGEVTIAMRRMAQNFRDLPKHVIFTALYKNDKSPNTVGGYTSSKPIRAELTPAVFKAVAAYVDIIAFLTTAPELDVQGRPTGRVLRYMVFEDPTNTYTVKKRFHSLPPYLVNPTFPQLLALLRRQTS